MKTIWKIQLPLEGDVSVILPCDFLDVMKVDVFDNTPFAWVVVDTDNPDKKFIIRGMYTGENMDDVIQTDFDDESGWWWFGTAVGVLDDLVVHYFCDHSATNAESQNAEAAFLNQLG